MDNTDYCSLIKKAEESLKIFTDEEFIEKNSHLINKYSEEEILEIFRYCLIKPSGKSWAPITQILLLLFQSAFSKNFKTELHRFIKTGNYLIHKIPENSKPIIYSFGIGTDITFDIAANKKYKVPIFMYDPTPKVSDFMKKFSRNRDLIFTNEGIFSEEKTLKFYLSNVEKKVNSSIYPIHGEKGEFKFVKCRTLKKFMEINKHDRIDILKMDVEGVAVEVLENMIEKTNIRPRQIVTEIEILNIQDPITYLPRVIRIMKSMQLNNYQIYNQKLTRKATIELIFVHESLIKRKLNKKSNLILKYFNLIKNDIKTLFEKYRKVLKSDFWIN